MQVGVREQLQMFTINTLEATEQAGRPTPGEKMTGSRGREIKKAYPGIKHFPRTGRWSSRSSGICGAFLSNRDERATTSSRLRLFLDGGDGTSNEKNVGNLTEEGANDGDSIKLRLRQPRL